MPIRVAVATDDGKSLNEGSFHTAKFFAIYDVLGKSPTRVEMRVNTRRESRRGPASVLEILRDCEVLIAKKFDPKLKEIVEARGIITLETEKEDVESAVLEVAENISRLSG
ncbi:MAG: hypothetical protein BA066_00525 [Candidatus Korarchaeota archaeon NZ13-K]|nr:MAG: hypothetical protein BA066_00525 [Candidatus Korarchaeota archaeon NZ13-K]